MIGTSLSHYRITEKLGAGGMGEVYRAEDTNLSRQVAIKVLPDEFAHDAERLARFEREAKLLASLNHPNIASIYGLEQADGKPFLVLELVEGQTLAERLKKGCLPLDETLDICRQIAEGLEAAHEKGIIHRDLKPANVEITLEGKVKILDFGLAKAFQAETPAPDVSKSPTLTSQMTRAGVILGTAAYMSPEQVRGKAADKRADIWAFGCILFEMLVGRKAFDGESLTDVFASVVKEDVDLRLLPSSTPLSIRQLLRRCMNKDPRERLHDVADARIVIHEAQTQSDESGIEDKRPTSQISWLWIGLGCLIGLVVGLLLAGRVPWGRQIEESGSRSHAPMRFEIVSPGDIGEWWLSRSVAISPEGDLLVFSVWFSTGNAPLLLRSLRERDSVPIPGTEGASYPFFSPDGRWVGFFQDGKLKKVRVDGGAPVLICDATNPFGGTWGPGGKIVFNNLPWEGLWEVPENGGEPKRLTTPDWKNGENAHFHPTFLPDGKGVLFAIWYGYGANRYNLACLDISTGKYTVLLKNVTYAVYAHSQHLVFARPDGLYAVGFDLQGKTVKGQEAPVARDLLISRYHTFAYFDLSRNGTLVCLAGQPSPVELVTVDLEGREAVLPCPPAAYQYPSFSPDGRQIAVNISEGGSTGVWILDRQTGRRFKLPGEGNNIMPLWCPKGDRVMFASDRDGPGQWKTYWQSVDGTRGAELFFDAKALGYGWFGPQSWSPDGQVLVGGGNLEFVADPQAGDGLLYLSMRDPKKLNVLIERQRKISIHGTVFSPDGHWIAFSSDEAGGIESSAQIFVTRFPEGRQKWMVSSEGGITPLWSPDGRQIYFYFSKTSKLMVVDVSTTGGFQARTPRVLFDFDKLGYWFGDNYTEPNWDISPDGKYFVVTRWPKDWKSPRQLNVTTNFLDVLRERVPAK